MVACWIKLIISTCFVHRAAGWNFFVYCFALWTRTFKPLKCWYTNPLPPPTPYGKIMLFLYLIVFVFYKFELIFYDKANKCQIRKLGFVLNFLLLGSNYTPNFRKFHQTVPKIICDGCTDGRTRVNL